MFPPTTTALLHEARVRREMREVLTREQEVLLEMGDGLWHSNAELGRSGRRFGGYLHNLKGKGVRWTKRPIKGTRGGHEYRLLTQAEVESGMERLL